MSVLVNSALATRTETLTPLAIQALAYKAAADAVLYTTISVGVEVLHAVEEYEHAFSCSVSQKQYCAVHDMAVSVFDALYKESGLNNS
jgi:uncharacterized OsmC-like protein